MSTTSEVSSRSTGVTAAAPASGAAEAILFGLVVAALHDQFCLGKGTVCDCATAPRFPVQLRELLSTSPLFED
eukprot:m.80816 g.80816  ORF g.80816 m.80816 type:complete len:73 (-) comp10939_c0_seq2:1464-1682(-)